MPPPDTPYSLYSTLQPQWGSGKSGGAPALLRTPCHLSDDSETMLAWMPTSTSFASLHAACGSHCDLTCTPSLTSSPPLFFSCHTWLLDVPSPMPSLLPHQSLCTCCVRSLEFSLPQTSSKFTPSLPAGGCSKPYLRCLHWSPYVKSGSQLLSYPLTLLCSSLLPIPSLQYICLLMSLQLPYFMREALRMRLSLWETLTHLPIVKMEPLDHNLQSASAAHAFSAKWSRDKQK